MSKNTAQGLDLALSSIMEALHNPYWSKDEWYSCLRNVVEFHHIPTPTTLPEWKSRTWDRWSHPFICRVTWFNSTLIYQEDGRTHFNGCWNTRRRVLGLRPYRTTVGGKSCRKPIPTLLCSVPCVRCRVQRYQTRHTRSRPSVVLRRVAV